MYNFRNTSSDVSETRQNGHEFDSFSSASTMPQASRRKEQKTGF